VLAPRRSLNGFRRRLAHREAATQNCLRRLVAANGDLRAKYAFLTGPFKSWLEHAPAEEIVFVADNHDQSIEALAAVVSRLVLNAPRWNGEEFLASKFDPIPDDADIVVGHGPPRGYGDAAIRSGGHEHVGSTAMTQALERVGPRLMVRRHIHSAYGAYPRRM
jgi:hypothetical protein